MGLSVNDYSSSNLTNKVLSKYSTNAIDTNVTADENTSYLDFDGYLELLTAQMSNQDFNNAMSDSEFIQQMSSYSMMEAISQLTKQNAVTYASSLIGKAVTVNDGSYYPTTGIVEAVSVTSNGCNILVNGSQYSTDKITDVVDGDVYSKLSSFIGQTIEVRDGDATVTGKVKDVIVQSGDGYVTLDNNEAYGLDSIIRVVTSEENTEEKTEEGTEGENTENSGTAEVEASASAVSYRNDDEEGITSRSQASYDTLMKMLDDAQEENTAAAASITEMYQSAAVSSSLERLAYSTASVDNNVAAAGLVPDYSDAGVNADDTVSASDAKSGLVSSRLPAPSVYNQYITRSNSTNSNNTTTAQPVNAASTYDTGDVSGVTKGTSTVNTADAESTSLEQFAMENPIHDFSGSRRKYADEYPLEAAFADEMGTLMADIRFIGNTSINSKVDTSEIICYSSKGRPVTDIGWSGKGILGEVVTFADGTQRVEIIGPYEVTHLYTTGNFTLDELCNPNPEPGCFVGKLTPSEIAIAHYGMEYTAEEEAQMREFEEYCLNHAKQNYANLDYSHLL